MRTKKKPAQKVAVPEAPKGKSKKVKEEIKCEICQAVFQGLKLYKKHSNKSRLSCCKCFREFANRPKLEKHHDLHISLKFDCDFCGQSFKSADSLKVHKLTHIGLQLKVLI